MQSAGMEGLPCPVHKRLDIEACCASLWTSHVEGLLCPVHKRLDIEACCASLWHSLPLPHVLFVGLCLLNRGDPELVLVLVEPGVQDLFQVNLGLDGFHNLGLGIEALYLLLQISLLLLINKIFLV